MAPPASSAEARGLGEQRGAAGVLAAESVELVPELVVPAQGVVGGSQLFDRRDQRPPGMNTPPWSPNQGPWWSLSFSVIALLRTRALVSGARRHARALRRSARRRRRRHGIARRRPAARRRTRRQRRRLRKNLRPKLREALRVHLEGLEVSGVDAEDARIGCLSACSISEGSCTSTSTERPRSSANACSSRSRSGCSTATISSTMSAPAIARLEQLVLVGQ